MKDKEIKRISEMKKIEASSKFVSQFVSNIDRRQQQQQNNNRQHVVSPYDKRG